MRTLQILWAFARRNLFWELYRDLYRRHVGHADCDCEADRRVERGAARLREALEALGPTFIKLGQVLSRRPDIVPRPYLRALEALQEHAAPVPFDRIRTALTARCICAGQLRHEQHDPHCLHCLPFGEVFDDFEEAPVASASLAQVHRAKFRGRPVAVKILRPGVLDVINTDLDVMRRVRGLLLRGLGLAGTVDARQFFEEFRRRLQTEVDLANEALNIDRFRTNRDAGGRVTAPAVYWEFRRSDLLVMEFVVGESLVEAARHRPARTRREIAAALVDDYLKQVFVDNFFHADPHPGNVLLASDGRLVYLDFGAVGQLEGPARRAMRQLFGALIAGDPDRAVRAVLALSGSPAAAADREGLQQELDRIVYLFRHRPGSRWSDEMLEAARRHRVPLPRGFLALAKGLLLIESLALELDPGFDFFARVQAMATTVTVHAMEEELTREAPRVIEEMIEALRGFPALLRRSPSCS